jgi:hypothetical protein
MLSLPVISIWGYLSQGFEYLVDGVWGWQNHGLIHRRRYDSGRVEYGVCPYRRNQLCLCRRLSFIWRIGEPAVWRFPIVAIGWRPSYVGRSRRGESTRATSGRGGGPKRRRGGIQGASGLLWQNSRGVI